jgi:hypothetical protein
MESKVVEKRLDTKAFGKPFGTEIMHKRCKGKFCKKGGGQLETWNCTYRSGKHLLFWKEQFRKPPESPESRLCTEAAFIKKTNTVALIYQQLAHLLVAVPVLHLKQVRTGRQLG